MADGLPPGYTLRPGSRLDRALLVQVMRRTYGELFPGRDFAHLAATVERYLDGETQIWWVERQSSPDSAVENTTPPSTTAPGFPHSRPSPAACLWLGNAVDQVEGDRNAYIFLLYVTPSERRRGIGSVLMAQAETWARQRGDRQISLQVFEENEAAMALYHRLGYRTHSVLMSKALDDGNPD